MTGTVRHIDYFPIRTKIKYLQGWIGGLPPEKYREFYLNSYGEILNSPYEILNSHGEFPVFPRRIQKHAVRTSRSLTCERRRVLFIRQFRLFPRRTARSRRGTDHRA